MPDPCGAFFHDVTLATYLQRHGHTCFFVYLKRRPMQSSRDTFRGFNCVHYMSAEKDLIQTDVWVTPHYPSLTTVRRLNERFLKPIVFTCHFAEEVGSLQPFGRGGSWAEAVCFMSKFMKQNVESRVPVFADTIKERLITHTFMDPSSFGFRESGDLVTGEYITLINANKLKGVEMFIELAKRFPNRKFLGVKPYYNPLSLPALPNIKWVDMVEDIREIMQETRILLTPSFSESFCRVAFEAMYNGIPVLYTRPLVTSHFKGGTTEGYYEWAKGTGIDCDFFNIGEWVSAIERLDNVETYATYSQSSYDLTRRMNITGEMAKMETFLQEFSRTYAAVHQLKQSTETPSAAAPRHSQPMMRLNFAGGRFGRRN